MPQGTTDDEWLLVQVMAWYRLVNVDPVLCRHMASLGNNEFKLFSILMQKICKATILCYLFFAPKWDVPKYRQLILSNKQYMYIHNFHQQYRNSNGVTQVVYIDVAFVPIIVIDWAQMILKCLV